MNKLQTSPDSQDPDSTEPSILSTAVSFLFPDNFWNYSSILFLCFLACWGGIALGQTPAEADILWPANGLLLGFLLQLPRRYWFSYLVSSVLANIAAHGFFPFSLRMSLIFSIANTVEILFAAYFLARENSERLDLTTVSDLRRFAVFGVILAPLASTLTVATLDILFSYPRDLRALSNWCFGEMLGIAIMTPLVLAMDKHEIAILFHKGKRGETVAILASFTALSVAIFAQSGFPIVFVLLPALLLAIFRLGCSGSAIGVSLMAVPAAYFTSRQSGPFAPVHPSQLNYSIFYLQSFIGISLIMVYAVSAALADRDRIHQELTEAYREADAIAALDHLTNLANRRSFDEHLAREWKRATRERVSLSVVLIDVDHFKLYNDRYGHLAGDDCLREVGTILAAAPLRNTDLAARFGGEEFAILLPRADSEGAVLIAERIRLAISDKHIPHISHPAGIVTVSAGVATIRPTADVDPSLLIHHADEALYYAKKNGRNQVQSRNSLPLGLSF
ncbi:diguanylate cyclase [Acidicapsa dinghuensis]|uniref:diguanylate cyclase n=1 Tax=Acidicapsa dinghuensis TaxID=2218256 RepID=A0ABW1EL46_9BACT|nr:diguanylate cyclase [Acidicapsa dinghuensis]